MIDIEALRKLEKAATPGPWGPATTYSPITDGELLFAMRNALPALLERIEAQDALLEEARGLLIANYEGECTCPHASDGQHAEDCEDALRRAFLSKLDAKREG